MGPFGIAGGQQNGPAQPGVQQPFGLAHLWPFLQQLGQQQQGTSVAPIWQHILQQGGQIQRPPWTLPNVNDSAKPVAAPTSPRNPMQGRTTFPMLM